MARKQKRKVKPKSKSKKNVTQKQKQTQRTTVTVNIVGSKRKPRANARANTNRVLAQFAQPLITLPSNLINPPAIPTTTGLNISSLQRGTNEGLTGNILGEDLAERERIRALREGLGRRRSESTKTPSFVDDPLSEDDPLRNYEPPEQSLSGFESLGSLFTVDTASDVSREGLANLAFKPFTQGQAGRPKKQLVRTRGQPTQEQVQRQQLRLQMSEDTSVPSAGNPSLRPPDPRTTERLIPKKSGGNIPRMLPKRRVTDNPLPPPLPQEFMRSSASEGSSVYSSPY